MTIFPDMQSSASEFQFISRRSTVLGARGMVAASQPLAAAAGVKILAQGGNAVDAAVATAAALNVTEPTSTGLGGDAFALYYQASTRSVYALNGSGRASRHLSLERLQKEGLGKDLPPTHAYTVTVPGACAAWCDILERFGRLDRAAVLAPAIQLAEEGFPVAPVTAIFWQRAAERLLRSAWNGVELTIDGRGPRIGEVFRNAGLARTLRGIAEGGKAFYYTGPVAEGVAEAVQASGGCLDAQDLAAHTSTWEEPVSTVYRGARIWECPPNGQGLAALLALNLLEGFDLASLPPLSTQRLHLLIEAMRLAFADGRRYIADPAFYRAPLAELLSPAYAAERRRLIDPKRANPAVQHGAPIASSDTVYFCAVDSEGNACSFVNSNYIGFGTGIVPRGWGFSLQNRGHNFSLDPASPNVIAPGKRPYHTIIAALATRADDNALLANFGVMGGFMQPQGHAQVAVAILDDQRDPQAALDRPRFCIEPDSSGSLVSLEEGIPVPVMAELASMGHRIQPVSGLARSLFGRGQVILRDPKSGVLWGGSDPRADGCVYPAG
jgi:gamma-glutamyltranspeptidase/glutathione hydrolase